MNEDFHDYASLALAYLPADRGAICFDCFMLLYFLLGTCGGNFLEFLLNRVQ